MRVIITGDAVGGVGVHAAELAQGLALSGHQVILAILGATGGMDDSLPGVERVVTPEPLEWESEYQPSELARAAGATRAWLADLAASRHIELLHSNHFALVGAIPGVPTLLGVHSDVVSWWRWVRGATPPANRFASWYCTIVRTALRQASTLVAPSRAVLQDLRESFGWTGVASVIPHGIHVGAAPPKNEPAFAITAGRLWDEAKQVGLLVGLELAMDVQVAGDDRGRPIPASPRLLRLGQLDRNALAQRLTEAQVYIASSRYEPFGLAPLEAAAAGCVLLLNDIPSLHEVWGPAALYFARNDGQSLAWALRQLKDAPRLRFRMGAASHLRASRLYQAKNMVRAYAALYQQLLAS